MAIYHLHMSNVSRSSGSSAVAADSYITGQKLTEDKTGMVFNYGRKQRVVQHGTVLADSMPSEWSGAGKLTNAIEEADKPKDSKTAKKIEMALPIELSEEQQKDLILDFIHKEIQAHGYGCVWAIHHDSDGKNPHAHILIANRPYKNGKWQAKQKSAYVLDENGQKIPIIDKRTGKQKLGARNAKQWVREKTDHYIDQKDTLLHLRQAWAQATNMALERAGSEERIDHRSYADQESEMIPTKHEGYAERRREEEDPGYISPVCEENRRIRQRNTLTQERIYERVAAQIGEWFTQLLRKTKESLQEGIGKLYTRVHNWFRKADREPDGGKRISAIAAARSALRRAGTAIPDRETAQGNRSGAKREKAAAGQIGALIARGIGFDERIAGTVPRFISAGTSTDRDKVYSETYDLIAETLGTIDICDFAFSHGLYIDRNLGRYLSNYHIYPYSFGTDKVSNRCEVYDMQTGRTHKGLSIVDFARAFIPECIDLSYIDAAAAIARRMLPDKAEEFVQAIHDLENTEQGQHIQERQEVSRKQRSSSGWER